MQRTQWKAQACVLILLVGTGVIFVHAQPDPSERFSSFWGSRYQAEAPEPAIARFDGRLPADERPGQSGSDRMHHWNQVALDTSGVDHTPLSQGETRVYGEQLGPGRASRAMAIVHVAIFDAINSIAHKYQGFTGIADTPSFASMDAAIAQAAHDTLVALFPSQRRHCDALLAEDLASIPAGAPKALGIEAGRRAAHRVLALLRADGSDHDEPIVGVDYFPGTQPGEWRPDPISGLQVALGAHWGKVRPMMIESATAYRVPPPPSLTSAEYARAYNEVKALGGITSSVRTFDQTMAGIYWAYDGTPSLCAPPRLYNQIVMTIADQMGTPTLELARLLALVNVAMSDTGIATWESKYYWKFWRPVTGIRESDPGTGPTGLGDGNPLTTGDPNFSPLGAPASNLQGPDFTPPFPAYPSGHAAFGGAVFQMLRNFYGTDNIPFTFVSDELNGETEDSTGAMRPLLPRTFADLSQAEDENGQSRIYLGIHWSFDKTAGIEQGRKIADVVFKKAAPSR